MPSFYTLEHYSLMPNTRIAMIPGTPNLPYFAKINENLKVNVEFSIKIHYFCTIICSQCAQYT